MLLSGRLISVFVEDVAGYIESQLKLTVDSLTLFGGLITDLGLMNCPIFLDFLRNMRE